ncbi:MAG TPA: glycosyltransferase family 1 protein [Candidatus Didemnitutus sp.]|jgi:glycosyltransferase involved in cell wall biosynthesis
MRRVVIINPLESGDGTGTARAAEGLAGVMPEGAVAARRINRLFRRINRIRISAVRQLARLLLAQVAPFFCRRTDALVFSSHHGPLWRTGRHAVIVHDLIALHFPQQSRSQHRYYRRMLPRVLRAATQVVTISESMRIELAKEFPETAAARAVVIPSYVARFGDSATPGRSLAERRQSGQLAFLGARYRHKNLSLVLRAMERPAAAGLRLVVTGCRRELWPELPPLEATHRVEVLSFAPEATLDRLYATSLALVYPSLAEGQGLPPLEAMRMGCPVVCADIPVLRETCGEAAFFVDPTDSNALGEILARMQSGVMDDEIENRIQAGFSRVASFGPDAVRARWRQFMKQFP